MRCSLHILIYQILICNYLIIQLVLQRLDTSCVRGSILTITTAKKTLLFCTKSDKEPSDHSIIGAPDLRIPADQFIRSSQQLCDPFWRRIFALEIEFERVSWCKTGT